MEEYVTDQVEPWSYGWIGFKGDVANVLDILSPVGEISLNYYTKIRSLVKTKKEVSSQKIISLIFSLFSDILTETFYQNLKKDSD